MSQRSRIQRLPGMIAHSRHTRTHPRPSSLFQSMLRQRPGTRLSIGLIVLCLLCTQLVASIASTIPIAFANTTITSSHFTSNSFLKTCRRHKKCPYDPASFSVDKMDLTITWGDPPPAPEILMVTNEDPNNNPIPWHVVIRTVNGIHWLHVSKSHGKVAFGDPIVVEVRVENENLPPGTCEGTLEFIPGHNENPRFTIAVHFIIPGPTSPDSCQ